MKLEQYTTINIEYANEIFNKAYYQYLESLPQSSNIYADELVYMTGTIFTGMHEIHQFVEIELDHMKRNFEVVAACDVRYGGKAWIKDEYDNISIVDLGEDDGFFFVSADWFNDRKNSEEKINFMFNNWFNNIIGFENY